ncbi:MAG TPA: hypothetical protein VMF62_13990 [Acetobacteraceae bacterium]|nr:hypothetical protein [Acetobacteraceae bacterium]
MTSLRARPILRAMRRLACLALLVLLGACTDHALLQRRAYLASFVGQSEADLVRQLGVPTRTFALKDETFLAYDDRHLELLPGFSAGAPAWGTWGPGWGWGWAPPIVVARGCESTFDIRGGKVVGLTMRGPDC